MVSNINYPISLDDDSTLFVAVNNLRTTLTASISAAELNIPVDTTAGFPNSGFITILTDPTDITQAEAIKYVGIGPTTFSGVERGSEGTPASPHIAGDFVDFTVVAPHHNVLKDAVIEIEKLVGVSGSENFPRFDYTGSIVVPGSFYGDTLVIANGISSTALTVSGQISADTGVFSQSLTISGQPVTVGEHYTHPDSISISTGNFSQSLTVSGRPVSTGTIDLVLLDSLYVNESGDTMSGDLLMAQNRIRQAGVAEVEAAAPTPAVGMIWYNTSSGTTYIQVSSQWEPISRYPFRELYSFTTANVPNSGGNVEENHVLNSRSLVNKLNVIPTNGGVNSFLVEIYKRDTFLEADLEYKATASGAYTDNDVWYHEDLDLTSELHIRITNNSLVDSTFTVNVSAEVFS